MTGNTKQSMVVSPTNKPTPQLTPFCSGRDAFPRRNYSPSVCALNPGACVSPNGSGKNQARMGSRGPLQTPGDAYPQVGSRRERRGCGRCFPVW